MLSMAVLLMSLPAHALSCAPTVLDGTLPARGAVDVPLNVLPTISLGGFAPLDHNELTLWDGDGRRVETSSVVISSGEPVVVQVQPEELLEEEQDYILAIHEHPPDGRVREVRFTTGSHLDLDSPARARIGEVVHEESLGDEWGDSHQTLVRIHGSGDPSGTLFRIELADDRSFSDATERIRLSRRARLTSSGCVIDNAATLDTTDMWVRVTPIDAAGNEGPSAVTGPQSGCAHVSGMQLGWLGIAVGMLGVLRRSTVRE